MLHDFIAYGLNGSFSMSEQIIQIERKLHKGPFKNESERF